MNLTRDLWIPVVFENGESSLVSLKDAFARGHEIRDLVATPPQRIVLTRLLVCVAQAALDGPRAEAEWWACRDRILPASVAYLERWQRKFELFGNDAFLQVASLKPKGNATLDNLGFGLAAGHNAVLFDHAANVDGRAHPDAWIALALLTYQCFSPGGTIGATTWSGASTPRNSEHAPCVEGSMLHAIIRGGSLLDTVHMNLLTKETVETGRLEWGRPVWEAMPACPTAASTYLGRLVPVARAIRLVVGKTEITLADGCRYPKLPQYRDPAATVMRVKTGPSNEEPRYRGVELSKHPWRDLAAVLSFSRTAVEGGAWVLGHLVPDAGHIDLWTGGLKVDKGKVIDVGEWNFHLPRSLVGSTELEKYRKGIELADGGYRTLGAATSAYCEDLSVPEFRRSKNRGFSLNDPRSRKRRAQLSSRATSFFWRVLDSTYGILIEAANDRTRDLAAEWYPIVRKAMEEAYQRACPRESVRQIRAYARGLQRLRLRKPGTKAMSTAP